MVVIVIGMEEEIEERMVEKLVEMVVEMEGGEGGQPRRHGGFWAAVLVLEMKEGRKKNERERRKKKGGFI